MPDENKAAPMTLIDGVAPTGWRKKVAAVLLQLGLGSERAAALYAAGREQLDTIEGRSIVNKALAEAVAAQAIADPVIVERAKARFLSKITDEQENVEAVLVKAHEKLLSLPSPTILSSDSGEESDSSNYQKPLDRDWAAAFTREAELATSDELRTRLASILATEVTTPGSFPRSIFRALVELEKDDLVALKIAMHVRFYDLFYLGLLPASISASIYTQLIQSGLISTDHFTRAGLFVNDQKKALNNTLLVRKAYGLYFQSVKSRFIGREETAVLSKLGIAATELIANDEQSDLKTLGSELSSDDLRIWLVRILNKGETGTRFEACELLHNGIPAEYPLTL